MLLNTVFDAGAPDCANETELDAIETGLTAFTPSAGPSGSAGRTGRADADAGGPWIACDEAAGVVEVHDPRVLRRGHEAFCRALVQEAVVRFGARRAEVSLEAATCRLEFGPGRLERAEMAERVASAVRAATPAIREGGGPADARGGASNVVAVRGLSPSVGGGGASEETDTADEAEESPAGRRRLVHLAMAGGSLTLATAAVILPGLPTLPFLIMTGRHAALVSPRIERMLKRHPWCAAMLAEAETSSGASMDWWSLTRMIGVGLLFAMGIWLLHPPLPVVLLLELGLMVFLGWKEWFGSDLAEIGLEAIG